MKLWLVATTAVSVLALTSPGASAAAPPFPWGQIDVTPNTGLSDGQIVQVSGDQFLPNTDLRIVECGPTMELPFTGGWASATCSNYSVSVTTDADGSFSPHAFAVSTLIVGYRWTHGHNVPATYDCLAANDCHIHVFSTTRPGSANQDISFSV